MKTRQNKLTAYEQTKEVVINEVNYAKIIKQKFATTKGRVEQIYTWHPDARDSDRLLLQLFSVYYPEIDILANSGTIKRHGRMIRAKTGYVRNPNQKITDELVSCIIKEQNAGLY